MKSDVVYLLNFMEGSSCQFIIPMYQRPYSWDIKHCKQLLSDIKEIGAKNISNYRDNITHFLGTIVYVGEPSSPMQMKQYIIIDGQQRITTVTLLLIALRDFDNFKSNNLVRKIDDYLTNRKEKNEKKYKLLLSKSDKNILLNLIDSNKLRNENNNECERVKNNFEYFKNEISKCSEEELDIIYSGLASLQIVEIQIDKESNPQIIFESMNSTGKELSNADLIRNFILMNEELERQKYLYENYWYEMEKIFSNHYDNHFNNFMYRFLQMELCEKIKITDIYEKFKRYARGIESKEILLKKLFSCAKYYCNIALKKEEDKELLNAFEGFLELDANPMYPLLLKLYINYEDKKLSKQDFIEIINISNSYVFRRSICILSSNVLTTVFLDLVKMEEITLSLVEERFANLKDREYFPSDNEFKEKLTDRDIYNLKHKKYILSHLENFGRKEKININEYTIEHIMPQKLNNDWKNDLQENYENFEESYKYLHKLGNLTLSGYNFEYSNKRFEEKKNSKNGFLSSPLNLNEYIRNCTYWGKEQIIKRGDLLSEKALEIWPKPKSKIQRKIKSDIYDIYNLDDIFENKISSTLYDEFKKEILKNLEEIEENIRKYYISMVYKKIRLCDIKPLKDMLSIVFYASFPPENPENIEIQNVSNVGKMGQGNAKVKIKIKEEIPSILNLILKNHREKGAINEKRSINR